MGVVTDKVPTMKIGDRFLIGPDMELRMVKITDLREQDVNAQVMQPREMERLVENMRDRGVPESVPYCCETEKGVEVISGHHRVRAARQSGLGAMVVLVDTSKMSLSQIRSKQIAHNALVGSSDETILRKMIEQINNVDDLLATGLPDDLLPLPVVETGVTLGTPHADFEWRTAAITFLPHQMTQFREVVEHLDGAQDMVGVAPVECFDDFAQYLASFARFREIRSVGTAIAVLTRIARDHLEMNADHPSEEEWVKLESVFHTDAMPASVGKTVQEAIGKRMKRDKLEPEHLWRILERWAAEELAS